MVYEEFRRQLGKAGVTAREFAGLIGLSPNSITNYSKLGEVPSHLAVIVVLMAELADQQLDFRAPLARIGVERKRVRGSAAVGRFGGSKQLNLPDT
ncbi:XRE family transcriptional regulator [Paraburkholderia strydomiana]